MTTTMLKTLRRELASATHEPHPSQPAYRKSTLPVGELRGTFIVTSTVIQATREALSSFAASGIYDGGHEGIAYWAGREMPGCTLLLQAIIPDAEHSAGSVMVSERELGRVQGAARKSRLGVIAQVHSHPGADARHSDGDDKLILMPFENMLSIVAPHFGLTLETMADLCVHQFQDGQWKLCTKQSVAMGLRMVEEFVDLRAAE
jgi:proteasome lid subunit RPN8/RPN11